MVYGIGTDICEVRRFEKWLKKPDLFLRFFNENEQFSGDFCQNEGAACRHYAARFAAKEAFSKALGTGFRDGIFLKDIQILHDALGKPELHVSGGALTALNKLAATPRLHISLSDDYPYAQAVVIIEK